MEYENDSGYDGNDAVMSKLKKLIEKKNWLEEDMDTTADMLDEDLDNIEQEPSLTDPYRAFAEPYSPHPLQKKNIPNSFHEEFEHEEKFEAPGFEQFAPQFDLKMPSVSFLDMDSEQQTGMKFGNEARSTGKSTGIYSEPKMEPFGDLHKIMEASESDDSRYKGSTAPNSNSANKEAQSNPSAIHEQQPDFVLRTVADDLLDLVRKIGKISVEDAAKKLKMPLETVQSLVDFLVEERIFGIEYKFTTPYIYIYKEGIKEAKGRDKLITLNLITKEQFYEKAKAKNVPYESIEGMWKKYLRENMVQLKEQFLKKSREKGVPKEKINELWEKYLSYL